MFRIAMHSTRPCQARSVPPRRRKDHRLRRARVQCPQPRVARRHPDADLAPRCAGSTRECALAAVVLVGLGYLGHGRVMSMQRDYIAMLPILAACVVASRAGRGRTMVRAAAVGASVREPRRRSSRRFSWSRRSCSPISWLNVGPASTPRPGRGRACASSRRTAASVCGAVVPDRRRARRGSSAGGAGMRWSSSTAITCRCICISTATTTR